MARAPEPMARASASDLEPLVRRVVGQLLGERGMAPGAGPGAARPGSPANEAARNPGVHVSVAAPRPGQGQGDGRDAGSRALITAGDLRSQSGPAPGSPSALWTPLAREEAWLRGRRSEEGEGASTVALACDHGGFPLKAPLATELARLGHRVLDLGTHGTDPVDYPQFAAAAARAVASGRAQLGLVVDGAGIGSAMAANKIAGVRAASANSEALARNARKHNHANLLTLGAGHLDAATALGILRAFLETAPGPGRHARRVAMIDALDGRLAARAEGQSR